MFYPTMSNIESNVDCRFSGIIGAVKRNTKLVVCDLDCN